MGGYGLYRDNGKENGNSYNGVRIAKGCRVPPADAGFLGRSGGPGEHTYHP